VESWLWRLLEGYPPAEPDGKHACRCCEQGGTCQEAIKLIVKAISGLCRADVEDVAQWVVESGIDLANSLLFDLVWGYRRYRWARSQAYVAVA
jgi:hypothetical protein